MDDYSHLATQLNSDPNLHFIIREYDMEKALEHPQISEVELALKKCALYAKRAIIVTKSQTFYQALGDHRPNAKSQWSGGKVSIRLEELYNKHNLASSSVFSFIPEKISRVNEEWEDDDFSQTETVTYSFKDTYKNVLGINVSLTDPHINRHIFESLDCQSDELSVCNIWLPELKNIPLDILLKLRVDEQDSFERFQYSLKKLIADFSSLDSESKAKEIFQKVDYEIRTFESKFGQIKKERALKTYEAILGLSVMGLCFAVPSETAQIVSSAIGIYGGKGLFSSLFREREQINNIKASDFYVPWLCTKK